MSVSSVNVLLFPSVHKFYHEVAGEVQKWLSGNLKMAGNLQPHGQVK